MVETSTVPEGTETEGWRLMSARVAWMFWLTQTRANNAADKAAERDAWAAEAADYRAYIRRAMRNLARNGIMFVDDPDASMRTASDEWRLLSARVAWMFWLTRHRATHDKDPQAEKDLWAEQAPAYRKKVRTALKALSYEDIGVVSS